MHVAVLGHGSAGSRLAKHLGDLGSEVSVVCRGEAPPDDVDALVVATPTSAHREGLELALDRGVHVYLEKPLAAVPDGVAPLLDRADELGLVVAVGYNLRFHPAIERIQDAVAAGAIGRLLSARAEVGQYLPDWQLGRDYRESYAARADGGGGALLTLSHELDVIRWIGGEIRACRGTVSRISLLDLDVDDLVELVCRHESGAVSSVHADFVDRSYNRRQRWVGADGTIAWEWGGDVVLLPSREVLWRDDGFDVDGTYRFALADFLAAIERGGRPRCNGRDGLRVVELCEEARA